MALRRALDTSAPEQHVHPPGARHHHDPVAGRDAGAALPCQVTLSLARTRVGTIDPSFGSGGDIGCTQSRSVTFALTP